MIQRSLFRILLVFTIGSAPVFLAAAQAQGTEPERLSLGVAAGVANLWHGDFDFTPVSWQADVRFRTGRFFASDVFFEQWRRRDEEVRSSNLRTPTIASSCFVSSLPTTLRPQREVERRAFAAG